MKAGPLVALNVVVAVAVVAGARLAFPGDSGIDHASPRAPRPAPDGGATEAARRMDLIEGRVEELAAAVEGLRSELKATRADAEKTGEALAEKFAQERERADAAEALLPGYTGTPAPDGGKKTDMDAFAKEVSKQMRKGIREEFGRIAKLIADPTPEALAQRQQQLKFFANAMGNNAGLDRAQIETFERILTESDEKARRDLRPYLVGIEDPKDIDYVKMKEFTTETFDEQDRKLAEEFPKEKAESLTKQMEPIRNLFGAMLDELEKEAGAPAEK